AWRCSSVSRRKLAPDAANRDSRESEAVTAKTGSCGGWVVAARQREALRHGLISVDSTGHADLAARAGSTRQAGSAAYADSMPCRNFILSARRFLPRRRL